MPYPAEIIINRIRAQHRELLVRPIDFVAAHDASIVSPGYRALEAQYKDSIDAMMHDATFAEKLKQILVPAAGVAATIVVPVLLNTLTGTTVAALSAAMAGVTFDLMYRQMESKGQGRVYLDELQTQINTEAYSALIKKSFESMAEDMLRAFCLREIRLKEHHDEASRTAINDDYLNFLVNMLNQNIKVIYGEHQLDIEDDANRWWLWKLIGQIFGAQEDRKTTTQAIQLGLLNFVATFHADLADEKTWVGTHPLRFTGYSAIVGAVIGLAVTLFIPSLVTLFWPVLVAAIGGGALFAAGAYSYATLAQFKRSAEERDANHQFEREVRQGEDALKARLLQESSLDQADVQLLQDYKQSSADGYWSHNHVAVGAPSSWLRTFARHYAHSKMVENDFAPTILGLARKADTQTTLLIDAIKASSGNGGLAPYLVSYMSETRQYLLQAQGLSVQKRYELVEKTKEQLLEPSFRSKQDNYDNLFATNKI